MARLKGDGRQPERAGEGAGPYGGDGGAPPPPAPRLPWKGRWAPKGPGGVFFGQPPTALPGEAHPAPHPP